MRLDVLSGFINMPVSIIFTVPWIFGVTDGFSFFTFGELNCKLSLLLEFKKVGYSWNKIF